MSPDGQYWALASGSTGRTGYIYVSTNFASTWSQTSSLLSQWFSVSIDETGNYLTACTGKQSQDYLYISSNGIF